MDTTVSILVVDPRDEAACAARVDRAFGWFEEVESRCNRFDADSELRRLCTTSGEPAPASELLFRAVEFGMEMARASAGAFDPTVGAVMEHAGFNRDYRSGARVDSHIDDERATFRDVVLDARARTIILRRPLLLDLGAVAKGLAIDLAARELEAYPGFAINAGGDVYARGRSTSGEPWRVGIRHPRDLDEIVATLAVSDAAVCTSGDYEREANPPAGGAVRHHIVDPRRAASPVDLASVTVIAPAAILADSLATAAFVLGAERGLAFVAEHGAEGMAIDADLRIATTPGFGRYLR